MGDITLISHPDIASGHPLYMADGGHTASEPEGWRAREGWNGVINGLVLMVFILLNVLIGGVILSAVAANAAAAWRSRYDEPTETPAEPAMVR